MNFRQFLEYKDIFGFDKPQEDTQKDPFFEKPVHQFDFELAMTLLSKKRIGYLLPESDYISRVKWGSHPGSIRVDVDSSYTFGISKLGIDRLGSPRWVTKKLVQLNRLGYGGHEETVVEELYEMAQQIAKEGIDSPVNWEFDLGQLVHEMYSRVKQHCKPIFVAEGVKKINDDLYIMCFGVRAAGLEAPGHVRVEQNQTVVSYDKECGTIRVFNYNIESPTQRHTWSLTPSDLDVYFFPSQSIDEITEAVVVHFKYY